MWEKITREEGRSETGYWISEGTFCESDSACDELKTHWRGQIQHSSVGLSFNKWGHYTGFTEHLTLVFFRTKENVEIRMHKRQKYFIIKTKKGHKE